MQRRKLRAADSRIRRLQVGSSFFSLLLKHGAQAAAERGLYTRRSNSRLSRLCLLGTVGAAASSCCLLLLRQGQGLCLRGVVGRGLQGTDGGLRPRGAWGPRGSNSRAAGCCRRGRGPQRLQLAAKTARGEGVGKLNRRGNSHAVKRGPSCCDQGAFVSCFMS